MEKQQKEFTDGWDPLFIGYIFAVYFHTCDIKKKSWTNQAKRMKGSLPPKFEVRDILRTLDQARLEHMLPVWDDGRMIVVEEREFQAGEEGVRNDTTERNLAQHRSRVPDGQEYDLGD